MIDYDMLSRLWEWQRKYFELLGKYQELIYEYEKLKEKHESGPGYRDHTGSQEDSSGQDD